MTVLRQVHFDLPPDEVLSPGHLGCPGCGAALAMRIALKALGRQTVLVIPACCWSVIDGPAPYSAAGVPVMHTPFGAAAAAASGVRAALDLQGDTETNVCAWAGDGSTFNGGVDALSAAAERHENILYVCYDNDPCMDASRKDLLAIMATQKIRYAATGSIAFPDDLAHKVAKARSLKGTRFLHVLAPCPPEWGIASDQVVKAARLAVMARVFPLVEVEHGTDWRITLDPGRVPLEEYVRAQGRLRDLLEHPDLLEAARAAIESRWQEIINRTGRPLCG